MATKAEKILGQPFIVTNNGGGGSSVATGIVAKKPADGYTILGGASSGLVRLPHMQTVPYKYEDFVPIMHFATPELTPVVAKSTSPWKTFKELVDYAKKNPGKFTYAHPGFGMIPHIVMEYFAMKEGIKWQQVPFKSGVEVNNAVLGGHTNAGVAGSSDLIPQVQAGKMKLLIIISGNRWSATPKVQTIVEKGHDFYLLSYVGIYGPKGLPDPIREKLDKVFKNAMKDPAFQDMLKKYTIDEAYMSGKDYTKKWQSLYGPMGKIVTQLGLVEK